MDASSVCVNLRRVRTSQKMSQSELADQAGLSREGYRQIEDGIVEPRVESLNKVAAVLKVRVEELLIPVRRLRAVRFRAEKRMASREDLLARVSRWLDDYKELEALLDHVPPSKLNAVYLMTAAFRADPIAAAKAAREALGLKDRDSIRDVCGLLEDHGIKVYTPALASEGFFGMSIASGDGGPAVVVNCWNRISVERWIFTALHELGHLLLHLDAYNVDEAEENLEQEKEANLFAGHFLMPDDLFTKEWDEARGLGLVDRVFKIKRIFRVSWKTVVYRIAAATSEPRRIWAQFYAAYKRQTGKPLRGFDEPNPMGAEEFSKSVLAETPVSKIADEPEHLSPSDFVEDRLMRLVRDGVEKGVISLGRGAEILDADLKAMRAVAASWLE